MQQKQQVPFGFAEGWRRDAKRERRPYGTPGVFLGCSHPTLKRGANQHCAYGAGGAEHRRSRLGFGTDRHCAYGAGFMGLETAIAPGNPVTTN